MINDLLIKPLNNGKAEIDARLAKGGVDARVSLIDISLPSAQTMIYNPSNGRANGYIRGEKAVSVLGGDIDAYGQFGTCSWLCGSRWCGCFKGRKTIIDWDPIVISKHTIIDQERYKTLRQ